MKQETVPTNASDTTKTYRLAYGLYLVLVIYLLFKGDIEWAVVNMGVALVFDPFDATIKWKNRPTYQKVWLFVHAGLVMVGFIYLIIN